MKSVIYYGKDNMVLKEVPIPAVSQGEAILEVRSVGVCPTDVKAFFMGSSSVKSPVVLGHEVSGVIHESNTSRLNDGQRVNVAADSPCLQCTVCKKGFQNLCPDMTSLGVNIDGGYSRFMRINKDFVNKGLVYDLNDKISFDEGALIEPVAVSLHCLNLVSWDGIENAVVIGDGPNALIHIQLLKKVKNVENVIVLGLSAERLHMASALGADRTVNVLDGQSDLDMLKGTGVDVIDITIGNREAMIEAKKIVGKGSRVLVFGGSIQDSQLPFTMNELHYDQLTMTGSSGTSIGNYILAADIVNSRIIDLKRLITERFSLSKVHDALVYSREMKGLKCVVNPSTG